MRKLKVNLYSFGRESFDAEVSGLVHELKLHGTVQSQMINAMVAQITFLSNVDVETLKDILKHKGFTKESGLSVNPYNDLEFEGQ